MVNRGGREFVCCGFSGHGMTQTFLCGAAVADMVNGELLPRRDRAFVDAFLPSLARSGTPWAVGSPH